jgi:hypothetical protein
LSRDADKNGCIRKWEKANWPPGVTLRVAPGGLTGIALDEKIKEIERKIHYLL